MEIAQQVKALAAKPEDKVEKLRFQLSLVTVLTKKIAGRAGRAWGKDSHYSLPVPVQTGAATTAISTEVSQLNTGIIQLS